MAAVLQIDQSRPGGPSFGTPGVARNDLWASRLITLTSTQSAASYLWTVKGPGGVTVSVTNPTSQVATFVPSGPGTYRIILSVNGGGGPNTQVRVGRVLFDSNGILAKQGVVLPAFMEGETGADEANYPDNLTGWDDPIQGVYLRLLSTARPVATYAALRLDPSRDTTHVWLKGRAADGDGGEGEFYWDAASVLSDDDGITIQATGVTTGRWRRLNVVDYDARWWGVKADGRIFRDGVLTAASNLISTATGAFTTADQGKRALVRLPTMPTTNPVTLTSGNNIITGTGFSADFAYLPGSGVPRTGAGICYLVNDAGVGSYRAILGGDDTSLILYTNAPVIGAATAKPLYRETQAECFVKYVSATQVSLWADAGFTVPVNAVVSETSVPVFLATDDTDAIERAINAFLSLKGQNFYLPKGLIGIYRNLAFRAANNVNIRGRGRDVTVLCELRKVSSEQTSAHVEANSDHGILSFNNIGGASSNVHYWDMSYDANLHIPGAAHSTGGVTNASGGRIGFFMRGVENPGFHRLGSMGGVGGFGARDEHIYHDTGCTNAVIEGCVLGDATHPTNGPSMNPVSGDGVRIQNNTAVSHFSALECSCNSPIITGNHLGNYPAYRIGAEPVIISATGRVVFCHNQIRDTDTSSASVGGVIFDGFGHTDYDCTLVCSDNLFENLKGLYGAGDGSGHSGVIFLNGFTGTAYITDNVGRNISSTSSYRNGRFIRIDGALTKGKIYVGGNTFTPNSTTTDRYMSIGLSVAAVVPKFVVTVLPGNNFAGCQTPYEMLSGAQISPEFEGLSLAQYLEDANQTVGAGNYSDTFTANAGTDYITTTSTTKLIDGNEIWLTSSNVVPTLPGGLVESTPYYVRDSGGGGANTAKLARTRGGTAIDVTSAGTGTHTLTRTGGRRFVMPEATQTTNRSVTLGTTGAVVGMPMRVERRDATANTLAVVNGGPGAGTLFTFASGQTGYVDFFFDGTNYFLPNTTGAGGFVPTARSLTGTDPVQIAGDSSPHDLSADRTIRLKPGTAAGKALIWTGSAWAEGTDFFAQNITTTGIASLGATTVTSMIVTGNLTVNGTVTTINSTTVDIADRVIHVNHTTGVVAVPSLICGIEAERGSSDGVTPRDAAAMVWHEGTAQWWFAFQTAANDSNLGTDLTIRALGANISGATGIDFIGANGRLHVTASGELELDADTISMRTAGGAYKGRIDGTSNAGKWRVGDSTTATRSLEIGSGGTTKFVFDTSNGSLRIGDGTTATHAIEILSGGGIWFDPSVSSPVITQGTSASSAGQSLIVAAQSAGGSNHDGGAMTVIGGAATGTGLPGSATLSMGDGFAVQVIEVGESQHVVSLARTSGLTSTQMPASTGDGVIYIAKCATPPSANSVDGGILYVASDGALKYRSPGGTVSTPGAA